MKEQEVLKACLEYIRWKGYYCQRVHSGLVKVQMGKSERWMHLADKGTPDILACIAGKFVGIEVKAGKEAKRRWHASVKKAHDMKALTSPDLTCVAQHEQMQVIEKAGGCTALVSSLKEMEYVINIIENDCKKHEGLACGSVQKW